MLKWKFGSLPFRRVSICKSLIDDHNQFASHRRSKSNKYFCRIIATILNGESNWHWSNRTNIGKNGISSRRRRRRLDGHFIVVLDQRWPQFGLHVHNLLQNSDDHEGLEASHQGSPPWRTIHLCPLWQEICEENRHSGAHEGGARRGRFIHLHDLQSFVYKKPRPGRSHDGWSQN